MRYIFALTLLITLPLITQAQTPAAPPWHALPRAVSSLAQKIYTQSETSAQNQLNTLTEKVKIPLRDAQVLIEAKTGDAVALTDAFTDAQNTITSAQAQIQVFKDAVVNTPLSWGYIGVVRREAVETFDRIQAARQALVTLQNAVEKAKQF